MATIEELQAELEDLRKRVAVVYDYATGGQTANPDMPAEEVLELIVQVENQALQEILADEREAMDTERKDQTMPEVKFMRLHPDAKIPQYQKPGDAGADICSVEDVIIPSGSRRGVHCGFAIGLPEGYEAQVRPRSGLALNRGIAVLNSPGTIDQGYFGEIGVILINHSDGYFKIAVGDRIAQLVVVPVSKASFVEVDELGTSDRGAGGYGSTGVR